MPFTTEQKDRLKQLGDKVKALREGRNLTQDDLAFKIGKDFQSLSRLEQGKVNPGFLYLEQVAEGLEVHISELLSDL